MKILNEKITDPMIIKETQAIIETELSNGKLYTFKKNYPKGYIELTPGENNYISCWGNIFTANGELVGRFSIIDKKLKTSILQIK